jgi:D-alanyl-D-alanine carboxypeptidase
MAVMLVGMMGIPAANARRHHFVASSSVIFEAIVLDADTGQVLGENNADAITYPASLTKMMTLYLTFEALNDGRLRLDSGLPVSAYAASRAPSRLGLNPGETVAVRDLILAIVTKSANDAATVLAEGLGGGSEAAFAQMMNAKAQQLGMQHTFYHNASGLPDPEQRTTARDIARLALALIQRFPREYRYFSVKQFDFRGEEVVGHDHLLDWYPGADGIKTGFINASGFNLATSAVQNGHRLIGVIMGGRTFRSRDAAMAAMLDKGFAEVAGTPPAVPQAVPQPIAMTAAAPAAPTPAQPAQPAGDEGQPAAPRANAIGKLAAAAMRAPAPAADDDSPSPRGRWGIQLGVFHGEAAAQRAIEHAARFHVAEGKPQQILPPAKRTHSAVYRARLLHFTSKEARSACATLHRRGITCEIVRPDSVKYASG